MSLIFGIDYDNTITADRNTFASLIKLIKSNGHTVVIVTGRKDDHPIDSMFRNLVDDVVYCGDEFKSVAALKNGYKVNIWIDDEPGHIEAARKITW